LFLLMLCFLYMTIIHIAIITIIIMV
jgi:hypothetical protein